jgi:hypothetical protein
MELKSKKFVDLLALSLNSKKRNSNFGIGSDSEIVRYLSNIAIVMIEDVRFNYG